MTHDNTWPVVTKFLSIGAQRVRDKRQIVITLDHDVQNKSDSNMMKYDRIKQFACAQEIDFYPAGHGIGHQIMVEQGYAWPGTLVVASDSHSNMYGGVGCLGTPLVRTDAASIWATGRTWWQIPPIARVRFKGKIRPGVTGKDVILALCGLFNQDQVLNHAIEFTGSHETLASIPIDDRLTIANMTTEWGALSGLFPIDAAVLEWLAERGAEPDSEEVSTARKKSERINDLRLRQLQHSVQELQADEGAEYAKKLYLDLSTVQPSVAGPNSVKVVHPVGRLEEEGVRIDKAYLVSCTNSRRSDLAAAAAVFKPTKNVDSLRVAPHVKFYLAPASKAERRAAVESGDWAVLKQAGAIELPAGCGPCIGLGSGLLEPGEVGISASNRNFPGRMGSKHAQAYLASPAVVAASTIAGRIQAPRLCQDGVRLDLDDQLVGGYENQTPDDGPKDPTVQGNGSSPRRQEIIPGFPVKISGPVVVCLGDNVSTDGIFPGKYTYSDGMKPEDQAQVVMTNYDEQFRDVIKPGDVLVCGSNFGCGSSREQAASALKSVGVRMIVAKSFGGTFLRNCANVGLVALEAPGLVGKMMEVHQRASSGGGLSQRTGWGLCWDIGRSQVEVEGVEGWTETVKDMPTFMQEIIARGGLEGWIKWQIQQDPAHDESQDHSR